MSRGRNAERPRDIQAPGWKDVGLRVYNRIGSTRLGLLAAGVAFYGLLSFFPAVTAGLAVLGFFVEPSTLIERSEWLVGSLPEAAGEIVMGQLTEVASAGEGALGLAALVGIGIALWSASNAMGSLMQGLNAIYEEDEERGFVKSKLLTIGLTLGLIVGLALSVTVVAAIPVILDVINAPGASWWASLLRWPIIFMIGAVGIAILYRYGPDRSNAEWRWLTPGAILGCLLWVAGTLAFTWYVQSFGSYNETFGALAGVIILITWMWLSAFIVLLGALFDAELEAQTRKDTTVGEDEPMGERGATKADRLGEAQGAVD